MEKRDPAGWVWAHPVVRSRVAIERKVAFAARPRVLSLSRAEDALREHLAAIGIRRAIQVRWAEDFQEAYDWSFIRALKAARKTLAGERTPLLGHSVVALECRPMSGRSTRVYAAARAALSSEWDRASRRLLLTVPSYLWLSLPEPEPWAGIYRAGALKAERVARLDAEAGLPRTSRGDRPHIVEMVIRATFLSCHWAFGLACRAYGKAWWEEEPGPELKKIPPAWLPMTDAYAHGLLCFWFPPGNTVLAVPRLPPSR